MPCLRQTSSVLAPASCSRRIAMICSSLNLERFIVRLPYLDGLYFKLEEFQGLRSITQIDIEAAVAEHHLVAAGYCSSSMRTSLLDLFRCHLTPIWLWSIWTSTLRIAPS